MSTVPLLAQLPRAGAAVVWLIVLGGLGLFIWRRIQGIPLRGDDKRADASDPLPSVFPTAPPTLPPALPTDLPPNLPPDLPSAAPSFPPLASPPSATADAGSPGRRSGFFAPSIGSEPGVPNPNEGRATVGEAVRGIVMPCGLTPVIDGSQSIPNPFRASFLTTTADAPTVGAGLADELERLGFTLSTATPTELLARRDTTELRVVLYVNPATAKRGLDLIFPAAAAGSVGVELIT